MVARDDGTLHDWSALVEPREDSAADLRKAKMRDIIEAWSLVSWG